MSVCIFCKIIKGEIPSDPVFRDDKLWVLNDINPKAPVHLLVVPKKHIRSLQDITELDSDLMAHMLLKINEITRKLGIGNEGYKVIVNNGESSGQVVLHLHMHVLGGWKKKEDWVV